MKNLKSLALIFALLIFLAPAQASKVKWGATGHRVVGKIADEYLKGKTKRKLKELLGYESLALVSTHADDIKSDKRYNNLYTWHWVNFPYGTKYEDSDKNRRGDLITGIQACKDSITSQHTSKETKAFYLKFLVHLVGDLHQPLHVGQAEDQGGNKIKLLWFDEETNLHRVWDSEMIDHYQMSYSELADNAKHLTKEQVNSLQSGSVMDWVYESQALSQKVYESAAADENLRYRYQYDHFGTVRNQLQKGGVRLAKVLNDLF